MSGRLLLEFFNGGQQCLGHIGQGLVTKIVEKSGKAIAAAESTGFTIPTEVLEALAIGPVLPEIAQFLRVMNLVALRRAGRCRRKGTGIAPPSAPAVIKPGTETAASILQRAGYETAVIGKWHLGLGGEKGPDWNGELKPGPLEIGFDTCFLLPTTNDRVPQVYVHDHRVLNLDPKDPLWVGRKKPSPDHPTGRTHRETLKMDWSHGHNATIHNGISRIGFYTGGHKARFRDEDLADKWVEKSVEFMEKNKEKLDKWEKEHAWMR